MDTPFPLGRHEDAASAHDPRSLMFPAVATSTVVSKLWRRYGAVLDQGNVGSCTGNAAVGCLNHYPFHQTGTPIYKEPDALRVYGAATGIDPWPGTYPPDDTGSDGLSVAKVLTAEQRIAGYTHAFGLDHVLGALMNAPLLIGIPWLEDMFWPDAKGLVHATGQVSGGHEIVLDGVAVGARLLRFQNSWGSSWGDYGKFYMGWDDFSTLLSQGGDATQFVPLTG